jgi:transcriptional repressor NrdR
MKCPQCGHEDTKVLESRLSHEGRAVRRRRSCLQCNYRYTTYEREEECELQVRKKDGRFESFSRDKALKSIQAACSKRPIGVDEIEAILQRVERKLQDEGERIVESRVIGDLIMQNLKELDQVAYVRFASVYKDFKDSEQFLSELRELVADKPKDAIKSRPHKH